MNDEQRKASEKIAKLLNMTVENGCTEDEAESAMRMAAAIAARSGIELDACRPAGEAKRKAVGKRISKDYKLHQVLLAEAAAILFGVECNYYNYGKGGLQFVGREENIELTEQTWFWLMRQVELLYKAALPKGLTKSARAEYRQTFKEACALRVRTRAENLVREMQQNNERAQAATGQNALVVQGYFDGLKGEVDEYWDEILGPSRARAEQYRLAEEERRNALTPEARAAEDRARAVQAARDARKASKRKPRVKHIRTGSGTNAGFAAAESVKLRDEIK